MAILYVVRSSSRSLCILLRSDYSTASLVFTGMKALLLLCPSLPSSKRSPWRGWKWCLRTPYFSEAREGFQPADTQHPEGRRAPSKKRKKQASTVSLLLRSWRRRLKQWNSEKESYVK